jgi:hypothetical protein
MSRQGRDWQGRPIEQKEGPENLIDVWEVTPHLYSDQYDYCVIRGWQDMLGHVEASLPLWLENFKEDELRQGVTIQFKLTKMKKSEYDDLQDPL